MSDKRISMLTVILVNTWKAYTTWFIMLLAGLKSLPRELVESASIDGANQFHIFWNIKLPHLKPVILSTGILCIIWAINSRFSLIVVYTGFFSSIGIWLLTSYFEGIPKSIDEAARIDGAGTLRILFQIIVPLAKPGLLAAGTTIILNVWQELMIAMTFISDENLRTLPVAVMGFIKSPLGTRWGPMTAAGVTAFIPVFILYLFMQKYMVKGMTAGSVKG